MGGAAVTQPGGHAHLADGTDATAGTGATINQGTMTGAFNTARTLLRPALTLTKQGCRFVPTCRAGVIVIPAAADHHVMKLQAAG